MTRIAKIAEGARRRVIARLAARLRDELPEAEVTERADGVRLRGRRILRNPRLVWIGSLLR